MLRHITEALIQIDPAYATEYRTNQPPISGSWTNFKGT